MRLKVTDTEGEANGPSEYFFEKDRVTIGRGSENDLTLSDPKRVVSSEHAEVRRAAQKYQLVDRGSKNFTYLRDQRLEAGEPYELSDGDVFQIGHFDIEFTSLGTDAEPVSAPSNETVFAGDFSNPFSDPADHLVEALNDITEAYDQVHPQRRDDALEDALRRTDAKVQSHEAIEHVLSLLEIAPSGGASSTQSPAPTEEAPPDADSQESPPPEPTLSSGPRAEAGTAATEEVLDILLEALSRIIEIPWQFRHEFIGQTIMQSDETRFLYEGDAAAMKEHLLDPSLSQEERQKRLEYVEEAAESLAVHQVAMLNGYKASVMEGAEKLLEQLDPDAHQADVVEETPMYEYLPILASPAVLERLRAEWHNLEQGEWSVAEQRIFRPAFIKAYLARMTAADPPSEESSAPSRPSADV